MIHIAILNNWASILIQHMFLSEFTKCDLAIEHHITGTIEHIRATLALLLCVCVPVLRANSAWQLPWRVIVVDNEGSSRSLDHLQLSMCGDNV